jgi:hypothetical protein
MIQAVTKIYQQYISSTPGFCRPPVFVNPPKRVNQDNITNLPLSLYNNMLNKDAREFVTLGNQLSRISNLMFTLP